MVNPAQRRLGIGSRIIRDLLDRVPTADMRTLSCGWREDLIGSIKFLKAHGFVEVGRVADTELDLAEFDMIRLAETC